MQLFQLMDRSPLAFQVFTYQEKPLNSILVCERPSRALSPCLALQSQGAAETQVGTEDFYVQESIILAKGEALK